MAPELETVLTNPNLDFTGKTIRVVTTHKGSGLGNVVNDVKNLQRNKCSWQHCN